MKKVSIIWLIFAAIFILLAVFHFYQATQKIDKFEVTKRPLENMGSVKILGLDIDQLTKDLAWDINKFIVRNNKSNKWMNILTGLGYLVASATAGFSFFVSYRHE